MPWTGENRLFKCPVLFNCLFIIYALASDDWRTQIEKNREYGMLSFHHQTMSVSQLARPSAEM